MIFVLFRSTILSPCILTSVEVSKPKNWFFRNSHLLVLKQESSPQFQLWSFLVWILNVRPKRRFPHHNCGMYDGTIEWQVNLQNFICMRPKSLGDEPFLVPWKKRTPKNNVHWWVFQHQLYLPFQPILETVVIVVQNCNEFSFCVLNSHVVSMHQAIMPVLPDNLDSIVVSPLSLNLL